MLVTTWSGRRIADETELIEPGGEGAISCWRTHGSMLRRERWPPAEGNSAHTSANQTKMGGMEQLLSEHLTRPELDLGLDHIRRAPSDGGTLELIVRRPDVDIREELDEGMLDLEQGLVGDSWRSTRWRPDDPGHRDECQGCRVGGALP